MHIFSLFWEAITEIDHRERSHQRPLFILPTIICIEKQYTKLLNIRTLVENSIRN